MHDISHISRVLLIGHSSTVWRRKLSCLVNINIRHLSSQKDNEVTKGKSRLFKVAKLSKRIRTYEDDKIDKMRAMAEFGLKDADFLDLPSQSRIQISKAASEKAKGSSGINSLYALTDVYHKALKVHGSSEALDAHRRPLVAMNKDKLTDAEIMRMRMRVETASDGNKGADRVVKIAFCLNAFDMLTKFAAAYFTGSKALAAEGIHSLMDTLNQLILLYGIRASAKNPDNLFPYGYGNMRYVTSLISGCGIAAFGCGLSIYHGVSGILHPSELEPLTYAYYALGMSLLFQGTSAFNAYREAFAKAKTANLSFRDYMKTAADPSLMVVLLEDTAAVVGVLFALGAISASSILNSPIPDAIGSVAIGALLGGVALTIIRTNAAHLVGRSLPKRITDDIVCRLNNDPVIRSVHDVKATALGVEQARFKAELDFDGRAITRAYLYHSVDMPVMLEQVKRIKTEEELENFMEEHGEKIIDRLGDEVDRIETEITRQHKDIRHVDLEAL